jgi:cobaltochelatase CobS
MAKIVLDPEVEELVKRAAQSGAAKAANVASAVPTTPSQRLEFSWGGVETTIKDVFGCDDTKFPKFPVRVFNREDWHPAVQSRIPVVNTAYHFDTSTLTPLLYSLYTGGPILLYGPTGTGKTSLIKEVCARTNRPFLRVSCHRHMESDAFLGRPGLKSEGGVTVTNHTHTDTTLAAMYGGILCIDEAFRSPILMAVQPLLEDPPSLTLQDCDSVQTALVPPDGKFNIVLTDNTNGLGDDKGAYLAEAQDLSTLARIRTAIYMDYMSDKNELAMVSKAYTNLVDSDIRNMIKVANLIRAAYKNNNLMQVMDIRALLAWAENFSLLGNLKTGFMYAFYSRLSQADKVTVNNIYRQVMAVDLE